MLFQDAVCCLEAGEFVSRDKWDSECGYLACLPGVPHFLKVVTQPQPNVLSWAATREDATSSDWKVLKRENVGKLEIIEEGSLELAA